MTDRLRSDDLRGDDFRAVRRLSDAHDVTLADVGETCERVPVASLAPLLASGHIAPVELPDGRSDDEAPA